MAKKRNTRQNSGSLKQNTTTTITNSFIKGMSKDLSASFQGKDTWYHARNAYNNSVDGDAGTLGNEPANLKCDVAPYTIIGTIHKQADEWIIYSTDDSNSEIGIFDDSKCVYKTLVNDTCLSFNRKFLITGAAKENYDCTWQVYWDDNLNPSRTLNIDDIPYKQRQTSMPGDPCVTFEDTDELDCEKIRLAPLIDLPCLKLTKAADGGQLRNGSYQAYIAYTENSQVVTDYIGISNIQSLFDHNELSGSLDLAITNLDQRFEEFELVILSNNNQQTVAKRIGIYSTQTFSISIDFIDPALTSVPLSLLFKRSPAYEKSESMFVVNDYLIRQGPTEQFDFNYQPLANQIKTEWVVAEYPAEYYYKGGNKTGFMRDEQYAFFIRWIYNTGERSFSYHIPGRTYKTKKFTGNGNEIEGEDVSEIKVNMSANSFDNKQNWQVYNTAFHTADLSIPTDDGGTIIAKGQMGYWQSTEKYPNKPEIWNSTHVNSQGVNIGGTILQDFDLCGKNIRHHKMPSEEVHPSVELTNRNNLNFDVEGDRIRILGVQFSNIKRPVFNDGTFIPNVVGYEILRSSREGAKSILAKGIFRNMREYDIPKSANPSNLIGLYPNYPYNDLGPDYYFHTGKGTTGRRTEGLRYIQDWEFPSSNLAPPLEKFRQDVFTFHSPELMFRRPFLSAYETRIYGKVKGKSEGYFTKSEKHPQQKLLLNNTLIIAVIIGFGYAISKTTAEKTTTYLPLEAQNVGDFKIGLSSGSSPFPPVVGPTTAATIGLVQNIIEFLGLDFIDAFSGDMFTKAVSTGIAASSYLGAIPGLQGGGVQKSLKNKDFTTLPSILRAIFSIPGILVYMAEGGNEIIEMFYNLSSLEDYTLKHNSHGFYDKFDRLSSSSKFRVKVEASNYLGSSFQMFGNQGEFKVNNLFRPDTVAVQLKEKLLEPFEGADNSNYTLGQAHLFNVLDLDDFTSDGGFLTYFKSLGEPFVTNICSLYGALKFDFDNQYGQLEGIKQVTMRGCVEYLDEDKPLQFLYSTQPIFSGDTYVNRYTEKTIMPIFTDFLNGQPDEFVFDYLKYTNIPYPRYHINSTRYDMTQLFSGIFGLSSGGSNSDVPQGLTGNFDLLDIFSDQSSLSGSFDTGLSDEPNPNDFKTVLPSDLYCLDVPYTLLNGNIQDNIGSPFKALQSLFSVKLGYMYTHVSGVQDFFVESEYNLAQRDWDDVPAKRHYDPYVYNDTLELFNADIIKKDNFYKYDISLSASRFVTNLTNYGTVQDRDYDPEAAEKCFTFYPKRLIYSLRAQEEQKKDFWRVYLPNNYKDFKDKVSVIKPINQTGALMFFPYASPKAFQGVDQLQTDLGTKITLGDGGLFAREPQNIANADHSYEYGSCESGRSVINTPSGVYFISQAQGKIFNYSKGLQAISNLGMKWWFNKYLPSILIRQFPNLEETELADNPVVGVGCQTVYDVNNDIVYFMKKDFSVKDQYVKNIVFDEIKLQFFYEDISMSDASTDQAAKFSVQFGDPRYFDDASWTVSYDPKIKGWVSFHDWHPELSLPSINHFFTTKTEVSDKPYCPPGHVYNNQTNQCEKLITEAAPSTVVVTEKESTIVGSTCQCEDGFTLVFPDPNNNFVYDQKTGDCITKDVKVTELPGNEVPNSTCDCFNTVIDSGNVIPISMTKLQFVTCDGVDTEVLRDSNNLFPDSLGCIRYETLTSDDPNLDPKSYYKPLSTVPCDTYACCSCQSVTVKDQSATGSTFSYVDCDGSAGIFSFFDIGGNITLTCVKRNSVVLNTGGPIDINYGAECRKYDCGPTTIIETTEYKALCRKVECECPTPPPNTTLTTSGECADVYRVTNIDYVNLNPVKCNYFSQITTPASFVRGGLWRHNYRCDLYSNFYGVDYPWEVEFVETTGQAVTTVKSVEYQLESYVYKGNLINGCGDDRWHDLDFNFDEAIISNSEQVSGLLRLELNPKENPFNILNYPIVGPQDIRILYSKVEQKYRFNQFWDVTNDRGEFSNAEQNIFITELNGYIKDLNINNLNYQKASDQRKKFRHYYNKVLLRRTKSNDRKMLLKLNNTKLNLSFR